MSTPHASSTASPALVGLCAWLVPGGGYYVMGQRSRAAAVGISIIVLFFMGIWIGGIRIMDPPGWGQYGYMTQIVGRPVDAIHYEPRRVEPESKDEEKDPRSDPHDRVIGPAVFQTPVAELSDKPWFVGQILCGPLTLAMAYVSVQAARPERSSSAVTKEGVPPSHSRSWEIGALYTAIAGMLNLLAIIDATFQAGQPVEDADVAA